MRRKDLHLRKGAKFRLKDKILKDVKVMFCRQLTEICCHLETISTLQFEPQWNFNYNLVLYLDEFFKVVFLRIGKKWKSLILKG